MTLRSLGVMLAVPPEAADHARGSEHARVTLLEYGDFECPQCQRAAPVLRHLLERFPSRIRFIYRHFPQEAAHPQALLAAEAAEAAAAQGQFWSMHDRLFAPPAQLIDKELRRHAAALSLDMARFSAELDDRIYLQRVREHAEGARRCPVKSVPAFFLGGALQDVGMDLAMLEERVAKAVDHTYGHGPLHN